MEIDDDINDFLDPRVLSSVLVSIKMAKVQGEKLPLDEDPQAKLLELMHSPATRALLNAAVEFSSRQGLAPHEALQQILSTLLEIDTLWDTVLLKKGLDTLSSQYH